MTSAPLTAAPAAQVAPVRVGSRLDDWWARVLRTPTRMRLWYWGAPIGVTLLAAILRLWNLGQPHALVFDETFYVKDAWSTWNLGYEGSWPDKADARFAAGETQIFSSDPSFVAHPPLGKWLIGLGMAATGAGSYRSPLTGTTSSATDPTDRRVTDSSPSEGSTRSM